MAASAPRKKAADKYAPTAWGGETFIDLEVPSGQLCQVRRPGVSGLVKAGLLDSLDSLTALVKTEHIDRVQKGEATTPQQITTEDLKMLSSNKDRLLEALDLMNRVMEYAVVQPSVLRPVVRDESGEPVKMWKGKLDDAGKEVFEELPLPDSERVPGQVYTDMIDPVDQVFIFQYVVGGVRDLETFRKEFGETLGAMESL